MENPIQAMCCFCGESIDFEKAVQLEIHYPEDSKDTEKPSQFILCHKDCLKNLLHKSVPTLH